MTTSHANCDHEATKAARTACRKARADREVQIDNLISYFASRSSTYGDKGHWVFDGARRFGKVHTDDIRVAADALLTYFADPAIAASAGRPTTSEPSTILSTIFRAAS